MIESGLLAGSAEVDLTANMIESGLIAGSAGSSVLEEVASVTTVFEGLNVLIAEVANGVNTESGEPTAEIARVARDAYTVN